MRRIYHLVAPTDWNHRPDEAYRADSLATEGFIHCSNDDQVARVANLFFASAPELWLLCIDADLLQELLRDEDVGTGERFPHVYGAIPREAVLEVREMRRDGEGKWCFPDLPRATSL